MWKKAKYLYRGEKMKKVLITGATSGIGLAISKKMLDMGYSVYGVGRDFSKIDIASSNFYPIVCDLIKYQNIEDMVKKLKSLFILIIV